MGFFARALILVLVVLGAFAEKPALADTDRVVWKAGVFTSRHQSSFGAGALEYRNHYSLLGGETYLNPVLGILANTRGGNYTYFGLRLGFPLTYAWHWENAVGMGYYASGNGPDLYAPLEFNLAVSLTRKVVDGLRLGIELFHISNAGFRDMDPGANSYFVVAEIAF
jgi:hypothetical protein